MNSIRFLLLIIFFLNIPVLKGNSNSEKITDGNKDHFLTNWYFQVDIFNIGEKEKWFDTQYDKSNWSKVIVSNAWDTYDEALWGYEGVGWYYTEISKEILDENKIIILKFNRVNYYTKIWLNGNLIGENIGGFLPFEIDISNIIKKRNINSLVLRVDNKPRINWLPASKQIEWVQYGGILQPVQIIQNDSIYIDDVRITTVPGKERSKVNCSIKIKNRKNVTQPITLMLAVPLGNKTLKKEIHVKCFPNIITTIKTQIIIDKAEFWTLEKPKLYDLIIFGIKDGKIYDKKKIKFGIRSVAVNRSRILLNDTPIYIKGVNRYDIFDKRGPILNEQEIRKDLMRIKQSGINTIRVHYPQSPLTLKLLDEIGLLLIEELPLNWWGQNWWDNEIIVQDTTILTQAKNVLRKMIHRDKNHPCIIAWSLANESKTDSDVGIYVMKELIKFAKKLDKTRLITFTVNNNVGKHLAFKDADFVSRNIYHGNDNAYHINMLDSLVRIPTENDIRNESKYYPDKPFIVSEFGAAGIKNLHGDLLFTEDFQAEYIKSVWNAIKNVEECGGGILWCWTDYYHRKYFNHTYAVFGPYGVLNVNKYSKKSLKVLSQLFNEK